VPFILERGILGLTAVADGDAENCSSEILVDCGFIFACEVKVETVLRFCDDPG
jgi:hypothetical protein